MKSNFDYITIRNYLDGKLDHQSMHEIEKRALDDPFLSDALEGYTLKTPDEKHLSILQRQLELHIALHQEKNNALHFSWQRLSIAAAAGLMFIIACILFWLYNFPTQKKPTWIKPSVENVNPKPLNGK